MLCYIVYGFEFIGSVIEAKVLPYFFNGHCFELSPGFKHLRRVLEVTSHRQSSTLPLGSPARQSPRTTHSPHFPRAAATPEARAKSVELGDLHGEDRFVSRLTEVTCFRETGLSPIFISVSRHISP